MKYFGYLVAIMIVISFDSSEILLQIVLPIIISASISWRISKYFSDKAYEEHRTEERKKIYAAVINQYI